MAGGNLKDCSRILHEVCGSGSASRIQLNTMHLEEAGWKIVSCESTLLTWIQRVMNSRAQKTERELEVDGILDRFLKDKNSPEIFDKQASTTKDSDEDYEPPVKKKATECLD